MEEIENKDTVTEENYFDVIGNIITEVTKIQKYDTFAYFAFIAIIDLIMSKDKEYVKVINKDIDKKPISITSDIQNEIESISKELIKG